MPGGLVDATQDQDNTSTPQVSYAAPDVMVDGVRCFFDDDAEVDAGKYLAVLTFRVGMADEHLPIRGLTHMVEHLTLGGLLKTDLSINGQVDAVSTSFMIHGTPEEITWFMNYVCESLAQPDHSRVPMEAQILRAEGEGRGESPLSTAMSSRMGVRSYGNRGIRELFFEQPDTAWIDYWIAKYFVAENATFHCFGPLPEGLTFTLPSGPIPPLPSEPWMNLTLPARMHQEQIGISISWISPITWTAAFARIAIQEHLFDRLRNELGLSYGVNVLTEPIGANWTHSIIHADSAVEMHDDLFDHFVTEMYELALNGFSDETLNKVKTGYLTAIEPFKGNDPGGRAFSALTGRPYTDPRSGRNELDTLTQQTLRDAMVPIVDSALWMLPYGVNVSDVRMEVILPWSLEQAVGVPTVITNPEDPQNPTSLVVDEHCITMFSDPERQQPVTVRFADCALYYLRNNGDISIMGHDGFVIQLQHDIIPNFAQLVGWLDQRITSDVKARERAQARQPTRPAGGGLAAQTHNWGR